MKEKTLKTMYCYIISERKEVLDLFKCSSSHEAKDEMKIYVSMNMKYTREMIAYTYRVSYCNYVHIFVVFFFFFLFLFPFFLSLCPSFADHIYLLLKYKTTITDVKCFHVLVVFRSSHLWFDLVIDEQFSSTIFMFFLLILCSLEIDCVDGRWYAEFFI